MLIAALSTGNKIGLAGTGAVFIVFALASAFLIPRRWPDYPGRKLGTFLLATIGLTIAMLAAVEFFAVEEEHEEPAEEAVVLRLR